VVDLFHANEDTDQCILETHCPNLKIISGSIKLPEIELNVENSILTRLKTALESLKSQFDFIIIDC
jgi:cellulose biosynthesis protein BcsQ